MNGWAGADTGGTGRSGTDPAGATDPARATDTDGRNGTGGRNGHSRSNGTGRAHGSDGGAPPRLSANLSFFPGGLGEMGKLLPSFRLLLLTSPSTFRSLPNGVSLWRWCACSVRPLTSWKPVSPVWNGF